jgi:DnaK suppressor protein
MGPQNNGLWGESMNDLVDADYVPSEDEPFMNERQKAYFRAKLIAWKNDILREARETLEILQQENANHPDLADRASSETDRAIELRARDRQRKLIAKIDGRANRAQTSRRAPDRDAVDRGAGTPRASRESLSRRLIGKRAAGPPF